MISNKNQILHCKCGGIGYYRAVVIKNEEVFTEPVLKEVSTTPELSMLTTLIVRTTTDGTTTPKSVATNKEPKIIFEKPVIGNTSNEELKLMTTTSGI